MNEYVCHSYHSLMLAMSLATATCLTASLAATEGMFQILLHYLMVT